MFEVGFTEIVLILGLALLVLGPEKLPGLAEKVGRWTGRARSMARQLRTQLEQEVTLEEIAKSKPTQAPRNEPDPSPSEPAAPASSASSLQSEAVHHEFDLDGFSTRDTPVSDSAPPPADTSPPADKVESKVTQ